MPRSRLRRRHPLLAAAACSAIVLLAVLCVVLTTRLSRCNANQSSSFSKLSASRMAQQQQQQRRHGSSDRRRQRLAVLVPYRDRPRQLAEMLQITARCLARGGADASIFVLEQAPGLHFNRGALLNAGALLLAGSGYDCFVLHDVDTVCGSHEAVAYRCPAGRAPLHLTPPGLHPRDDYPEFLGGNIVFTPEQFARVNGFHHAFWGWGKEDNNMVRRLQLHSMWPPEHPHVRRQPQRDYYWRHLAHARPNPVLVKSPTGANSTWLANLRPQVHNDNRTGLRETRFTVQRIDPTGNATRIVIELACDRLLTPWCEQMPA